MKTKNLFLCLMAVTLSEMASAQKLSVADVEVVPGETAAFALTIDVEGGAYNGFQFQMQFPTEGFATAGTTIATDDWEGGSFAVGDLTAGAANASAYSSSATDIPDGSRVIGTVKFTVDNSVALGDYAVTITNFNFLDGTNYTPVTDVTFTVRVVSMHTVVLDENSTVAPDATDGEVIARVLRTIKANEWSTICLPFAMTTEQVRASFGDDVQLCDFDDYEYDDGVGSIRVNFKDATEIAANHPYIIKVSSLVAEFTVDNVVIDPQEAVVDYDTSRRKNQPRQMVGNYVAGTVLEWGTLFLNSNQFWYSVGNTTMKAFRAYFNFNDLLPDFEDNYEARVIMSFEDETTSISGVGREKNGHARYYNLNGQQVEVPAKGIFVKSGKKVVVK